MRVLMTGGGTGGHINPAIAIADMIKQNEPGSQIAFVGTKHGKEVELVPRAGYQLYFVEIQGIARSLSPSNIKTLWYVLTAPSKAKKLIREFKPDIVIGTGGYACWPTLKAASELGIPTAVHESNAIPGLAVRKLQKNVDRILINFEQTAEKLSCPSEKILRVGNPLRGGFGVYSSQNAKKELEVEKYKYIVMSFGGSLGAEPLNGYALEFMKCCAAEHPDILYIHAAGTRYYEKMREAFESAGLDGNDNIRLCDYIHNMHQWMAAADLVISRSGAMTISELSLMRKACILIPSPNVVDNHQFKNAKILADEGAAILLREEETDGKRFTDTLLSVLLDNEKIHKLQDNICRFADADANRLIYEEIKRLIKNKKTEG